MIPRGGSPPQRCWSRSRSPPMPEPTAKPTGEISGKEPAERPRETPAGDGGARANFKATKPVGSVGEPMAPSANAMASGRSGASQGATRPTVRVVKITRPMAGVKTERRARTNSRRGMNQPSRRAGAAKNRGRKTRERVRGGEGRHEGGADAAEQVGDEGRPGHPAADGAETGDPQEEQEGVLGSDQGSAGPMRYSRRRVSMMRVTGPSLTRATAIRAPNWPVATGRPRAAERRRQKVS